MSFTEVPIIIQPVVLVIKLLFVLELIIVEFKLQNLNFEIFIQINFIINFIIILFILLISLIFVLIIILLFFNQQYF